MQSTQHSCPHCGSQLHFGEDRASAAAVPCLICGQTVAAVPPPIPVPPAANTRLLVVGGAVFAAVALVMIGGMSLLLMNLFAPAPDAVATAETPAPPPVQVAPPPVPVTPPPEPPSAPAPPAPALEKVPPPSGEVDVADLNKPASRPAARPVEPTAPESIDPKPEPVTRINPAAGPVAGVKMAAGGATGVEQKRIDAAITRGVTYLKKRQDLKTGAWLGGPPIGYTALAGLTLLECNVPADDPSVVKAATFVRKNSADLNTTYELSLAILFLDRLGNPKDNAVIQGMALRLLAGQNEAGGWTYTSHVFLTPPEMHQLLVFLKSHRPATPLPKALNPAGADPRALADAPGTKMAAKSDDPFQQLADLMRVPKSVQESSGAPSKPTDAKPDEPKVGKPVEGTPMAKDEKRDKGVGSTPKKVTPINPRTLPTRVQQLPVVELNVHKGKVTIPPVRGGDNSNTQFALMGLWAARRHDVPTEYSLQLAKQRFTVSQNPDDGWGYLIGGPGMNAMPKHLMTKDTMTCVGLMGLAMGHGVHADVGKVKDKLADPAIQKGLSALGQFIGNPSADPGPDLPIQNHYFLWSVERVAMLYDLKTIGGKDWYGWGAQTLLAKQEDAGSWSGALPWLDAPRRHLLRAVVPQALQPGARPDRKPAAVHGHP